MKKLIIPFFLILILVACGGKVKTESEDQETDKESTEVQENTEQNNESADDETIALWEVNEDGCLTKINVAYDNKSEYTSGDYKSLSYTWFCINYNDQPDVYVSLDFDNNHDGSTCLTLDDEYISTGICY